MRGLKYIFPTYGWVSFDPTPENDTDYYLGFNYNNWIFGVPKIQMEQVRC